MSCNVDSCCRYGLSLRESYSVRVLSVDSSCTLISLSNQCHINVGVSRNGNPNYGRSREINRSREYNLHISASSVIISHSNCGSLICKRKSSELREGLKAVEDLTLNSQRAQSTSTCQGNLNVTHKVLERSELARNLTDHRVVVENLSRSSHGISIGQIQACNTVRHYICCQSSGVDHISCIRRNDCSVLLDVYGVSLSIEFVLATVAQHNSNLVTLVPSELTLSVTANAAALDFESHLNELTTYDAVLLYDIGVDILRTANSHHRCSCKCKN